MKYEKLKPVNISFLLVDHDGKKPIKKVKLCDVESHEVFDDLMELTIVYVPTVSRSKNKADDLYLFAKFFMVSSQGEADEFSKEFGASELGKELIFMYNTSVANVADLRQIEESPYFIGRLSEAELEEAREEAREMAVVKVKPIQPTIISDISIIKDIIGEVMTKPTKAAMKRNKEASDLLRRLQRK